MLASYRVFQLSITSRLDVIVLGQKNKQHYVQVWPILKIEGVTCLQNLEIVNFHLLIFIQNFFDADQYIVH